MSEPPILEFRGPTYWLSNFYPVEVEYHGLRFPSVENAYQAAKFPRAHRSQFQRISAKDALARAHLLLPSPGREWHLRKIAVMHTLLAQKFRRDTLLAERLLDTGDAHLEEGNTHGDTFWGTVDGQGENCLGVLLMEVRRSLQ